MANGSSVPACPTRFTPCSRRTRATMSCEVGPDGLSASTTRPVPASSSVKLLRDLGPDELDDLRVGHVGAEAGGALVPSPALFARDRPRRRPAPSEERRLTLRATRAAVGLVADDAGDERALERAEVVDDALGEVLGGAGGLVVGLRDVGEGRRSESKRSMFSIARPTSLAFSIGTRS